MSWRIIQALITKDLMLFFRDKLFGIMTIVAICLYIGFYFIMPRNVKEIIEIGIHAPKAPIILNKNMEEEGFIIKNMRTEDELRQAVADNELHIGISVPEDILKSFLSGEKPRVFVYYLSDLPDEIKEMYTIFMGEMINQMSGAKIELETVEMILGPDMGGKQIPYRNRMIPLFIFMLLIAETMGLANLITSELENGTIQALLTTPMKIIDLFAGKGFTGVFLAFSQTVFLMIITGSLTQNVLLIIITLLLGSLMITGLAFYIASISKNLMSVVAWSSLSIVILSLPTFTAIFPGPVSGWIKMIPSFSIVDILHRAVNYNIGWSGNVNNLIRLIGFNIIFIVLGIITLKRKL